MPRVKLFNKEEVTQKAMELFWEKGYASTSLNDLTAHLGISKGSLYDTFGSKRALFERSFELYRSSRLEQLESLLASEPDVKAGLRKFLEFNLEEFLADDQHKGCFIANTCSEFGAVDEALRNDLMQHHSIVHSALTKYLRNGQFKMEMGTDSYADMIMTFTIGMSQEVKYNRDRKTYLNSISYILDILK